jgi:hypothetical protein
LFNLDTQEYAEDDSEVETANTAIEDAVQNFQP